MTLIENFGSFLIRVAGDRRNRASDHNPLDSVFPCGLHNVIGTINCRVNNILKFYTFTEANGDGACRVHNVGASLHGLVETLLVKQIGVDKFNLV